MNTLVLMEKQKFFTRIITILCALTFCFWGVIWTWFAIYTGNKVMYDERHRDDITFVPQN